MFTLRKKINGHDFEAPTPTVQSDTEEIDNDFPFFPENDEEDEDDDDDFILDFDDDDDDDDDEDYD